MKNMRSVGKRAFVQHYELFNQVAAGTMSFDDAVENLVLIGACNDNGAKWKIRSACSIIRSGKGQDALTEIINSTSRVPDVIKRRARQLLLEEMK